MPRAPATVSIRSTRRPARLAFALAIPLALASSGAPQPAADAAEKRPSGVRTVNGLRTSNGLRDLGRGAASAVTPAGLRPTSALMSTAAGRSTASYLVRCALPAGRSITKRDSQGVPHTFEGQLGLAPEWEAGRCDQACQEWVSACMLSLVNTRGAHVPVWMLADHPAVGRGTSDAFPRQEGAFFGNLFTDPPQAFYCKGRDYQRNPATGRIGSAQVNPPYTDAFAARGDCQHRCQVAAGAVSSCGTWDNVVTVYRQ